MADGSVYTCVLLRSCISSCLQSLSNSNFLPSVTVCTLSVNSFWKWSMVFPEALFLSGTGDNSVDKSEVRG